jgi:hypothetical protein
MGEIALTGSAPGTASPAPSVAREQTMSSNDDMFGDNADGEDDAGDFERHGRAIHELVQDYLEDHDIPDSAGSLLLLNAAISMRMIGYATEREKPSGGGLKLDLERFGREMDQAVRHAKKGAEDFIEEIKPALEAARIEDEKEGGEQ